MKVRAFREAFTSESEAMILAREQALTAFSTAAGRMLATEITRRGFNSRLAPRIGMGSLSYWDVVIITNVLSLAGHSVSVGWTQARWFAESKNVASAKRRRTTSR